MFLSRMSKTELQILPCLPSLHSGSLPDLDEWSCIGQTLQQSLTRLICSYTTNIRKSYRLYLQHSSCSPPPLPKQLKPWPNKAPPYPPEWCPFFYRLHSTKQPEGPFKAEICSVSPMFKPLPTHWLPISLEAKLKALSRTLTPI